LFELISPKTLILSRTLLVIAFWIIDFWPILFCSKQIAFLNNFNPKKPIGKKPSADPIFINCFILYFFTIL